MTDSPRKAARVAGRVGRMEAQAEPSLPPRREASRSQEEARGTTRDEGASSQGRHGPCSAALLRPAGPSLCKQRPAVQALGWAFSWVLPSPPGSPLHSRELASLWHPPLRAGGEPPLALQSGPCTGPPTRADTKGARGGGGLQGPEDPYPLPGSGRAEHSGAVCVSVPSFGFRTWGRCPGSCSLVVILESLVLLNTPRANTAV